MYLTDHSTVWSVTYFMPVRQLGQRFGLVKMFRDDFCILPLELRVAVTWKAAQLKKKPEKKTSPTLPKHNTQFFTSLE